MPRRPRVSVMVVVAIVVLAGLAGCERDGSVSTSRTASTGRATPTRVAAVGARAWQHLTDVPGPPRMNPTIALVGSYLVVFGGTRPIHCPPGSYGCIPPQVPGGEVLDLATSQWRRMGRIPHGADYSFQVAVVDAQLALLGNRVPQRLFLYDPAAERWQEAPPAPIATYGSAQVTTIDGRVYVSDDGSVQPAPALQFYDPATDAWTEIPLDASWARFAERAVYGDSEHLFLTGATRATRQAPLRPHVEEFAAGAWTALPDLPTPLSCSWSWTGTQLIAPVCGSRHPHPGVGYDATTNAWAPLSQPPAGFDVGLDVYTSVPSGQGLFTTRGLVYDASNGEWQVLTSPRTLQGQALLGSWDGDRLLTVDDKDRVWLSPAYR